MLSKQEPSLTTTNMERYSAPFYYKRSLSLIKPQDIKGLSFAAGDMIEVLEETNINWWRGRHRGREGLFPSSCVERVTNDASRFASPPPVLPYSQIPPHMVPPPFSLCPPGLPPPQPYYGPPLAPYPPYNGPPPPPHHGPPPVMLQTNQPDNKKPGPFGGGLGNTVCNILSCFPFKLSSI